MDGTHAMNHVDVKSKFEPFGETVTRFKCVSPESALLVARHLTYNLNIDIDLITVIVDNSILYNDDLVARLEQMDSDLGYDLLNIEGLKQEPEIIKYD
jgi:hypothetical protein